MSGAGASWSWRTAGHDAGPVMKRVLYVDGASRGNPGPAAIGVVIQDERGRTLEELGEAIGEATNNVAEYRAVLRGLDAVLRMGADEVEIRSDSQLLVRQLTGRYQVKSPGLRPLYEQVRLRLGQFRHRTVTYVPREANRRADELANRALDAAAPRALDLTVLLEASPEGVRATVPALPGVATLARTREEALQRIRPLAEQVVRDLLGRGAPLPQEERIRVLLPPIARPPTSAGGPSPPESG